jgi:hypothetical protein
VRTALSQLVVVLVFCEEQTKIFDHISIWLVALGFVSLFSNFIHRNHCGPYQLAGRRPVKLKGANENAIF